MQKESIELFLRLESLIVLIEIRKVAKLLSFNLNVGKWNSIFLPGRGFVGLVIGSARI